MAYPKSRSATTVSTKEIGDVTTTPEYKPFLPSKTRPRRSYRKTKFHTKTYLEYRRHANRNIHGCKLNED